MDDRLEVKNTSSRRGETGSDARKNAEKTVIYVGQPQNLFCRGARFDGVSRMKIHPPPPGCEPNEYQSMLMNKSGEILFTPAPARQGRTNSKNKITPNVTVVADIQMA